MNFIVHYEHTKPLPFYSSEKFWLQGTCFQDNKSISSDEVYSSLIAFTVDNFLKESNGFFNFILQKDSELFAAVDAIRSLPLFYSLFESDFYISDSAEWIANRIGKKELDAVLIEEFKCTGYVTGEDTLISEIKQIQAGEYIWVKKDTDSFVITKKDYFLFTHTEPVHPLKREEYIQKLDSAMNICIENLLQYAAGRQIVISLSGGRDSRLIAMKLAQKKYTNVLCFSYGSVQHQESIISKNVAEKLGLKWTFIPYTEDLTNFLYNTDVGLDYFLFSHNYVSLPHRQDLFAVYELKQKNLIDENCIFVPGHAADFVAGSHIPSMTFMKNLRSRDFVNAIYDKHYSLYCNYSSKIQNILLKRISENSLNKFSSIEFANSIELWDWRNRQAKYITNSIRVYEYFDFSWWLPFWDRAFSEFWKTIPLEYRYERNMYNEYVDFLSEKYSINVHRNVKSKSYYFVRKLHCIRAVKRAYENFSSKFPPYNERLLLKKDSLSPIKGFYTSQMIKDYSSHTNELNGLSIAFFMSLLADKRQKGL